MGTLAAGGASLAVAGGFVLSALSVRHDADRASGEARGRDNEQIDTRNRWATGAAITGGVLAALGTGLLMWHRHAVDATPSLW